jgi:hypothetical protein
VARKTIDNAVENLRQVAPFIGQRYTVGVQGADWQGPASSPESEANYAMGVQQAIADGRRIRGITAVSNQQWRDAAVSKGAAVIGQRVLDSLAKYRVNFAPILQAQNNAAAALPPRTASARQNVTNRLLPIIEAAQIAAGKTPT